MVWEGPNPPKEPEGYDPDNKYADPVLYFKHRDAKVAEEYVKVAEAKVRRSRRRAAPKHCCCVDQPMRAVLFLTADS